jgi:hypothetical protein
MGRRISFAAPVIQSEAKDQFRLVVRRPQRPTHAAPAETIKPTGQRFSPKIPSTAAKMPVTIRKKRHQRMVKRQRR